MPESIGWARLWALARPATEPMLRHGAWYPIVQRGAGFVMLNVHRQHVAVPAHLLEMRADRPARFTVVYRAASDHNPARNTNWDLGRTYAVCPVSGDRVRVAGRPEQLRCPSCGHRGPVAWLETG